jgi:hypothetical protein
MTLHVTGIRLSPVEMTDDAAFNRRIARLVAISATMLGAIFVLAATVQEPPNVALGALAAGWVTMPALLAASLRRPWLRRLLIVPAALVAAGLLTMGFGGLQGTGVEQTGWWTITAGILIGATLGSWFWYRWLPVPAPLHEPFSAGRWALVAVHAGTVVLGLLLVVVGSL